MIPDKSSENKEELLLIITRIAANKKQEILRRGTEFFYPVWY